MMLSNSENTAIQQTAIEIDELREFMVESMLKGEECFVALRSQHGGREILQMSIPAQKVPALFKTKPPTDASDPHSGKNRPVIKGHAEEIKEYILKRAQSQDGKWILGTLTANISKQKLKIHDIKHLPNTCLVKIPMGIFFDITDGQHRTRAIKEILQSEGDERDHISTAFFPVTLVLEEDDRQSQMDFRDMAQATPIPKSLLVSFGAIGRDGIAQEVEQAVTMFRNKTEKIKSSPGNSGNIYTIHFLAKAVSCLFANDPNNELIDLDVQKFSDLASEAFNNFFTRCESTIPITKQESLKPDDAKNFRENCLLGMSVGLEILSRLMFETYDQQETNFNYDLINELADLNWSRDSEIWLGNVVRADKKYPIDSPKHFKISASASAVSDAIQEAKQILGWV